jgi:hypothetical protein
MVVLLILGSVALVAGVLSLSQATSGVGLIAVACFFAICARIAQASPGHVTAAAARVDAEARDAAAWRATPAVTDPQRGNRALVVVGGLLGLVALVLVVAFGMRAYLGI